MLVNMVHRLQQSKCTKDSGRPKIHRLRMINTYESEYNLILKILLTQKGDIKS